MCRDTELCCQCHQKPSREAQATDERDQGRENTPHNIASHLLENGMEIRYIMEILGHDRLSTTQTYCKVTLTGLMKHWRAAHPRERAWAKASRRTVGAPPKE